MPAPVGRDLELTRKQLTEWFTQLLPDARDVSQMVIQGKPPQLLSAGSGFSPSTGDAGDERMRRGRFLQIPALREPPWRPCWSRNLYLVDGPNIEAILAELKATSIGQAGQRGHDSHQEECTCPDNYDGQPGHSSQFSRRW